MSRRAYCPDPRLLGRNIDKSGRIRPIPVVTFAKGHAWAVADGGLPLPFPMTLAEAQACAYCRTREEQHAKLEQLRNPPRRTRRSRRGTAAAIAAASMLGTRGWR